MYSVYRITFDGPGLWSFDNGIARNVKIFGIDNNSSSHADNHKKNFLVLGEEATFGKMEDLIHQKKKININFSKANTKLCLSWHYNVDNSCLFANGKEISKFKADNKNVNSPTQFCLWSVSNGFSTIELRAISLIFQSITTLQCWKVWVNGWVFVYELNGCEFLSSCSHVNVRYGACFEQGVPWHSGNYRG